MVLQTVNLLDARSVSARRARVWRLTLTERRRGPSSDPRPGMGVPRCVHRGSRSDTRSLNPPRWCSSLDTMDACTAAYSTTIHGEPRLCQWLDVGCRSGNQSLCASDLPSNSSVLQSSTNADLRAAQSHWPVSMPAVLVGGMAIAFVAKLLAGRASVKEPSSPIAIDTHHELERLADPPPVSMDIDFPDDETEVTFLPAEDLRILREADNDDESVVTFLPEAHEAAEAKCAASAVADDSATARVEASDEREPHASSDDLSIAFTQEHAEQAAARYRLSRQVQGADEASISHQRRTRNQREAKRAELSTHDFDLPTIAEQKVADSAARMAETTKAGSDVGSAASRTRAKPVSRSVDFGLD